MGLGLNYYLNYFFIVHFFSIFFSDFSLFIFLSLNHFYFLHFLLHFHGFNYNCHSKYLLLSSHYFKYYLDYYINVEIVDLKKDFDIMTIIHNIGLSKYNFIDFTLYYCNRLTFPNITYFSFVTVDY